jgi:hypothetical protein
MTDPVDPRKMVTLPRRTLLATGLAGAGMAGLGLGSQALAQSSSSSSSASGPITYEREEILATGSNFLGVTVEALGGAIERIFSDYGDKPTAYIAGEEASGAVGVGLRYGKGNLFMKTRTDPTYVYWQGPSVGFDTGGNASRVFTLVYHLNEPDMVYRRFPGVEGSAYFIGGLGVNYQRAEGIVLAPIRAGVGFRLGANVGYLAYSKKRRIFPL